MYTWHIVLYYSRKDIKMGGASEPNLHWIRLSFKAGIRLCGINYFIIVNINDLGMGLKLLGRRLKGRWQSSYLKYSKREIKDSSLRTQNKGLEHPSLKFCNVNIILSFLEGFCHSEKKKIKLKWVSNIKK